MLLSRNNDNEKHPSLLKRVGIFLNFLQSAFVAVEFSVFPHVVLRAEGIVIVTKVGFLLGCEIIPKLV
jgi:lipid-binding SYLF domain-containing protein